MTRKKILFFIESFSGGGAERVLYTILKYIDRDRFEVTVLVMSDVGVQSEAFHQLGIRIVNVLGNKIRIFNNLKYKLLYNILPTKIALGWLLKGLEADTYVAFVEGYCTKVFSRLSAKKKKIAWVHIDLDTFPWTVNKGIFKNFDEERRAYSKFNKVIGVSQSVTTVLRDKYRLPDAKMLYNPIDEARIKRLASSDDNMPICSRSFNMVSIGRLTRQKGYDKLIQMMPDIIASNPNVKLYIIGEGEERKALEYEIKRLQLEDNVILTGFMDNPYSLLKKMDLFVCSSRAESFSLVIAEAMIIGLPIISMECAGPCELLDFGKYGILCKSYEDLCKSITAVANDRELQNSLRTKSRNRGMMFNTKYIVRSIEKIL